MIHCLQHKTIDFQKWDQCIAGSVNRRVYGFSWYLNIVSPGWDALVEDDYVAVFPLTHNRKFGINYLAQPFFTQQLGIFSSHPVKAAEVNGFIDAIPKKYRLVEINLNSYNNGFVGTGEVSLRLNHEMNLAGNYAELASIYSQNARRNIRKSMEAGVTATLGFPVDDLIALFAGHFGRKEGKLQEHHYQSLRSLMIYCLDNNKGMIRGALSDTGALSSGAFFLFDHNRVYFLFAASSPGARSNGSMFFLVDRFIEAHAGNDLTLDFEGGHDPDLGRFYKGFGAREVKYPVLRINRLSKASQIGHNLKRFFGR